MEEILFQEAEAGFQFKAWMASFNLASEIYAVCVLRITLHVETTGEYNMDFELKLKWSIGNSGQHCSIV